MNRGFESRSTRLIFGNGRAVHLRYGTFPLRPSLFNFNFFRSDRFLSYAPMSPMHIVFDFTAETTSPTYLSS